LQRGSLVSCKADLCGRRTLVRFRSAPSTATALDALIGGPDAIAWSGEAPTVCGPEHAPLAAHARPEEVAPVASQVLAVRPVPTEQAPYQLKHRTSRDCLRLPDRCGLQGDQLLAAAKHPLWRTLNTPPALLGRCSHHRHTAAPTLGSKAVSVTLHPSTAACVQPEQALQFTEHRNPPIRLIGELYHRRLSRSR
jgi:hypothetical protein